MFYCFMQASVNQELDLAASTCPTGPQEQAAGDTRAAPDTGVGNVPGDRLSLDQDVVLNVDPAQQGLWLGRAGLQVHLSKLERLWYQICTRDYLVHFCLEEKYIFVGHCQDTATKAEQSTDSSPMHIPHAEPGCVFGVLCGLSWQEICSLLPDSQYDWCSIVSPARTNIWPVNHEVSTPMFIDSFCRSAEVTGMLAVNSLCGLMWLMPWAVLMVKLENIHFIINTK